MESAQIKKIFVFALAFCMILTLAACGSENQGGTSSAPGGGEAQSPAGQSGANGSPSNTPGEKEYLLIGRLAPLTGAIANFGAGTPFIEEKAVEALNADGGIYIEEYGKKLPIKFIVADTESSSTKASEAATKLILDDGIDLMIVSHTADTVNPVAAVCERYKVPCISVDAPADMWLEGGPYTYNYHAFFNTDSEIRGFSSAWDRIETNKKVGILCANDIEGISFAAEVVHAAESQGYTAVDPGRFTSGTNDFTTIINAFLKEDVDIITGAVLSPDFAVFWRQAQTAGFIPKICAIDKANLFMSDVDALGGGIGNGCLSEVWWRAEGSYGSSLTGQSSQELSDMYLEHSGLTLAPPTIGYKHANVEILVDVLQRAQSLQTDRILAALAETNLDTCVGHIEYDENNMCIMEIAIGQWVLDENGNWTQNIVSNQYTPHIPLTGDGMIPVPGSE